MAAQSKKYYDDAVKNREDKQGEVYNYGNAKVVKNPKTESTIPTSKAYLQAMNFINWKQGINESAPVNHPRIRAITNKQGIKEYEVVNSNGVTVKKFTDKEAAKRWYIAHRIELFGNDE